VRPARQRSARFAGRKDEQKVYGEER